MKKIGKSFVKMSTKFMANDVVHTNPLANARSYSADSSAADKKSNTGIFPFSVYELKCDFNGTDLHTVFDFMRNTHEEGERKKERRKRE